MTDKWGNRVFSQLETNDLGNLKGQKIAILCGSLSISGGTNLILNYAEYLQSRGAKVTLFYLLGSGTDSNWHPSFGKLMITKWGNEKHEFFDLAIFTWWRTVIDCSGINASKALYFIQSLENRFARNNNDDDSEIYAASTYLLNLPFVTVASWIAKSLFASTGQNGFVVRNGVNKALFHERVIPIEESNSAKLRVLIEGPFGIPMKAVEETFQVVKSVENVEIWHVNPVSQNRSSYARTFSNVPYFKMAEIYKSCDLIVKLSRVEGMFGPPLEAFHVGTTALVSRVTGYTEYIIDGTNALSVDVDDFESATVALRELQSDRKLLDNLKENALLTSQNWPSIEETAREFAEVCSLVLHSSSEYSDVGPRIAEIYSSTKERLQKGESMIEVFGKFLTP